MAASSGDKAILLLGVVAAVVVVPMAAFFMIAAVALGGVGGGGGESGGSGSQAFTEEGDVEFVITYYDPGQGGINGTNCGGAHGSFCLKAGSPTGYEVTEERTGKKFTGGSAIPQSTADGGPIPIADYPLYYDHEKGTSGKAIVIPCYNDDQPFLPLDHFATSVTAPNALDLVMTGEANSKFLACLEKRNIKTSSSSNGHGAATKIKGKIVRLQ